MSFFAPIPEPERETTPEEPDPSAFVPPEWTEPPLGFIGADVGCSDTFFHDERLCLRLDRLLLYPTGLILDLELWQAEERLVPGKDIGLFPWALVDERGPHDHRPHRVPASTDEYLRFGVQFADGRRVATGAREPDQVRDMALAKDQPEGLVLLPREGSGGRRLHRVRLWLWPSPPPGPVTLVVAWPALQVPESQIEVPDAALQEARSRMVDLWPR